MAQVVIENPILNSPFEEPRRHFRFGEEGITNDIVDSRRISSYFIPIAKPKKKGGSSQLHFETEWTEDRIEENKFINQVRAEVASIVEACTDTVITPKPPWRARKEAYIAHLAKVPTDARIVSIADKLHNARSILSDYRLTGESLWSRFNGGREGTLWYYRTLVTTFRRLEPSALIDELDRTVTELETLALKTR